jgi:foldase protein PrsA
MTRTVSRAALALACVTAAVVTSDTGLSRAQTVPAQPRPSAPAPKPVPKPQPQPPAPTGLPTNVVARVGGEDITADQVLGLFDLFNGQPLVEQMVQARVIEQEAKRLGVVLADAELNEAVQETKDRVVQQQMMTGGQPMTFAEISARDGISEGRLRWSTRLQLLLRKAFVKAKGKEFPNRDNQVKLAHILVATINLPTTPNEIPKEMTEEERKQKEANAKTKIDALYAGLNEKKITWDEAVKSSEDPSTMPKKGELDFYPPGTLDPEFERVGFTLKAEGDISAPVKSRFGWHIIRMVKRGKDLPPAEKAAYRKQQEDAILGDPRVLTNYLAELRAKAGVVLNPKARVAPNAPNPLVPTKTPTKPVKKGN